MAKIRLDEVMNLDVQEATDYAAYLGQLSGWFVIGVTVDDSDPTIGPIWGLLLGRNRERKIAWVLSDPEGNGPGRLDIVDTEGV